MKGWKLKIMAIEFIKAGLQTSLQDNGYHQQMQNGIPKSGAMDPIAMTLANWLVSKPTDSPLLEISLVGPELRFTDAMQIAICGADFDLLLNQSPVKQNMTIDIAAGDCLKFGKLNSGARAYLAFSGTPKVAALMGSYSTNITCGFGGYKGRAFKNDDSLELSEAPMKPNKTLNNNWKITYSGNFLIRVTQGIEYEQFDQIQVQHFINQQYKVSPTSNRMGLRLNGSALDGLLANTQISTGICQGSIQIPANGLPIIATVECQTIGGYPRIANVIQADLHLLGQMKPNTSINFQFISVKDAQRLWRLKNNLIRQLDEQ